MAKTIVAAIGPHHTFWEPFCGSLAVLLRKPPSRTEVVGDQHGDLVNLARAIQHRGLGPILYRRLRRVWFGERQFLDSKAALDPAWTLPPEPDVERAFDYFVVCWQGMNGVAGTAKVNANFARRFTSGGGDPARRWVNAVGSIPAWRERMRGVTILHSDGIMLCGRIEDAEGTSIFADPPYLVKGSKYLHDFQREIPEHDDPLVRKFGDHGRLAKALRSFRKTRVVVSYYAHPGLAELYPGWGVTPIDVPKSMVNGGMRDGSGGALAPEVLLTNDAAPALAGLFD